MESAGPTGQARHRTGFEVTTSSKGVDMPSIYEETPIELLFPPQVLFSWTLRGARARRLRAQRLKESRLNETTDPTLSYRIAGSARQASELAAAIAYCDAHGASLELD
jgi:hypothetical protein